MKTNVSRKYFNFGFIAEFVIQMRSVVCIPSSAGVASFGLSKSSSVLPAEKRLQLSDDYYRPEFCRNGNMPIFEIRFLHRITIFLRSAVICYNFFVTFGMILFAFFNIFARHFEILLLFHELVTCSNCGKMNDKIRFEIDHVTN